MDNAIIEKYRELAKKTGGVVVQLDTVPVKGTRNASFATLHEVGVVTQETAAKIRELIQQ